MNFTRRDFLKLFGASAAFLGLGAKFPSPSVRMVPPAPPVTPNSAYGILIDTAQCIGCQLCVKACKEANNLPAENRVTTLSPTALTIIDFKNISPQLEKAEIKPVKRQCMHCEEPACVSVCPVAALTKNDRGAVVYDDTKCIGCRYCMVACPFGVPKYNWTSPNPKINKCTYGCMADGKRDQPACVQICPVKALSYGKRDELLAIAKSRIEQEPERYVNQVYGEKEVGGTTMLYLSATPFDQLGFRTDLPTEPLPNLTWAAQELVPPIFGGLIAVLSGIAWWTHRPERKKLVEVPVIVTSK